MHTGIASSKLTANRMQVSSSYIQRDEIKYVPHVETRDTSHYRKIVLIIDKNLSQ